MTTKMATLTRLQTKTIPMRIRRSAGVLPLKTWHGNPDCDVLCAKREVKCVVVVLISIVGMKRGDDKEQTTLDNTIDEFGDLSVGISGGDVKPDPAAFLQFQSHNHAASVLKSLGFSEVDEVPCFDSETLTNELNELLKDDGISVMDMSTTIPKTSAAAYQALTVASLNASCLSRKDESAAFLFIRTELNTPSFLFGVHWGLGQSHGREETEKLMAKQMTPSAYVFFKTTQLCITSRICTVEADTAAAIIAYEMTKNDKFLPKLATIV